MIECRITSGEQGAKYYVSWYGEDAGKYPVLYLRYHSLSSTLSFGKSQGKQMKPEISRETVSGQIEIPRVRRPIATDLPQLPAGLYRFELYDALGETGKSLKEQDCYIGSRIQVFMKTRPYRNSRGAFVTLAVACGYPLPRDWFWLKFSDPQVQGKERFYLSDMELSGEEEGYEASCLLKAEAVDKLEIGFEDDVKQHMEVIRHTDS